MRIMGISESDTEMKKLVQKRMRSNITSSRSCAKKRLFKENKPETDEVDNNSITQCAVFIFIC